MDQIVSLGFTVTINWNRDVTIMYEDFSSDEFSICHDIFVLIYVYPMIADYYFTDAIDIIVDEFNHWYDENIHILNQWVNTKDVSLIDKIGSLGDITNQVSRQLRIGDILDEKYDF